MFTKFGDKFKVDVKDLSEGLDIKVVVKCDNCGEIKTVRWYRYIKYIETYNNFYCRKCKIELFPTKQVKMNFNEVRNIIDNKLGNDWEITDITRIKKYIHVSLIDAEGYRYSDCNIFNIRSNTIPGKFHKSNKYVVHNINNFLKINNKNIQLPEDTMYNGVNDNMNWVCLKCNKMFKAKFISIQRNHYYCPHCGDKVSYPNKFLINFLGQIKKMNKITDYKREYSESWLKFKFKNKIRKGFLDAVFELNNKKYAIEMDGGWHFIDNTISKQTKQESKFIDEEKDRLCKENNIEVIRVDCTKSDLNYIKKNLMRSILPNLLNFKESDIDWAECHKYACGTLIKDACDLWNEKQNIKEIARELKLTSQTVRKYLRQGAYLNWCNYDSETYKRKSVSEVSSKKIICLTTNEIFKSIKQASDRYNIHRSGISLCCRKKQSYAGEYLNKKLVWMYYEEYVQQHINNI